MSRRPMKPGDRHTAAKCAEAIVEGRLVLVIEAVDREAVAEALADLLLAALAREQGVTLRAEAG
jgi:hypothetical protein